MKRIQSLILLASFCIGFSLIPLDARAIYSLETTFSTGYYRDIYSKPRNPVLVFWTLNHTASNQGRTYIDLGVQNGISTRDWRFSAFQAYVDYPIGSHLMGSPSERPHLVLGRQMLMEGFDLSVIDGIDAHYAFTPALGVKLIGGVMKSLDTNDDWHVNTKVASGVLYGSLAGFQYRGGYAHKYTDTLSLDLGHGTLYRDWTELPWSPNTLVKGQWNLRSGALDQAIAQLQVFPNDKLSVATYFNSRQPNPLDTANTLFIYRLFSASTQEQVGGNFSYAFSRELRLDGEAQHLSYKSAARRETGSQQTLGLAYTHGADKWTPAFTHMQSWGGRFWQGGLRYVRTVSETTRLHGEADVVKLEKINGIKGWAHHGRGGVSFQLGSRFLAMTLVEVERNPIFKVDSRVVAYVSHYLY